MKEETIAILLATYNGERYLREQIDSLYAQTRKDWTLYVHDDGSTDGTRSILEEYAREKDNFVILDYPSQKGASNNFFSLLRRVDADYYFFADQDDQWLPRKIEKTMNRMRQVEAAHAGVPVLVCCDACVTDESLQVTSPSLWQQAGTHPEFLTTFDESAATPFVTGCTMVVNQEAKRRLLWDKIAYATMHDAFITLCVLKSGGVVSPVFESLMYYRQHGDNTLGAFSAREDRWMYKLRHIQTVLQTDIALLRMLRALGYGSIFKFLKYKRIYKQRVRNASLHANKLTKDDK